MYDLYLKKVDQYKDQEATVFAIIIGHCEDSMKHWIECFPNNEKAQQSRNVIGL